MKTDSRPSINRVKELLKYCGNSGELRWRRDMGKNKTAGKVAGCRRPDNYIAVRIDGRLCLAHHLAWVLTYGEWPEMLDHRDCVPSNNRIDNLRPATHSQNKGNKAANANNTSGFKGVFYHKQRDTWVASIKINGRSNYLGCFATPESAHAAYATAAKSLFGEFARAA